MPTVGLWEMALRYASASDKCILAAAITGMTIYGASRPLFSVMFGRVTRGVSKTSHGDDEHKVWE